MPHLIRQNKNNEVVSVKENKIGWATLQPAHFFIFSPVLPQSRLKNNHD
jgi:hypothetical protein